MFGLDFIRKLKPCKWFYRGHLNDGVEHFGFIAQDVADLAPPDKYAFTVVGPDGVYKISLGEFIGPLTKAIQELDAKVTELEKTNKRIVRSLQRLEPVKGEQNAACNMGIY